MNATVEIINAMGRAFVGFALPMLVQSSLLIVILLAVDVAMRKRVRAVFRYWIWMLVLAKLVLPPSLGSPVSIGTWFGDPLRARTAAVLERGEPRAGAPPAQPRSIAGDIFAQTTAVSIAAPVAEPYVPADVDSEPMPGVTVVPPAQTPIPSLQWQALVLLSWAAVAAALLLLLLQRAFFVRGLVAQADEASAVMQENLTRCRRRIGLRREATLKLSAIAGSPAACGLIRPVILIPQSLAPRLELHDLQAVLLHELAHVKRGDLWVNLIQTMLQIVYFYNPLLWLANMMMRRIREQAVDEAVLVAMGDAAQQYPETLVNIAKLAFRKRPGLSLRLVGVVESKSALAARIRHILTRPLPTTARLGLLGLIVVCVTAAVLLPMGKAATRDRPFSVEGGPLDIQLVAVRLDAGDEYCDPAGNKLDWTGGVLNTRMDRWDTDDARRDFLFKSPDTNEPLLFATSQHIHVAGRDAIPSGGMRPMGLHEGNLLYVLPTRVPRSRPSKGKLPRVLSGSLDVRQIDLTLRYFYGPPQDPICTFTGPFEAGRTFAADGNLPYQLTWEKLGTGPVDTFRLNLPAGLVADDDVPVLIYDTNGKRHHPPLLPSSKATYVLVEGSLARVTKITIGEKPHERVFRNVVVGDPHRPARSYAAYLDRVAKTLSLERLPKDKLAQYHFRTPQEAIAVLDIVQGGELTRLAVEAITYGKPSVELSRLDEPTRDKVHSVAQKWAASFDLDMRSRGVQLGLLGPWPEFFDQAISLLQDDYHYLPETDRVVSDLGRIVWLLLNRWRDRLTKDQYDNITSFYNGRRVFPVLAIADRGAGGAAPVEPGKARNALELRVAPTRKDVGQNTLEELGKALTAGGTPADANYIWVPVRPRTKPPVDSITQMHEGMTWMLVHNQEDFTMVAGQKWRLGHVGRSTDRTGKPVIVLAFNDRGEASMQGLTEPNGGRSLAVIVNGIVVSVAVIPEGQMRRTAVIAGDFTEREREEMIATLRRGIVEPAAGTDGDFRPVTLRRNGVTVELLGICEHPSVGKQWWRPDGSPLEERPYDDDEGRAFPQEGERGYKFAVKFSGLAGKKVDAALEPSSSKTTNRGGLSSTSSKNGKKNMKYRDGSLDEVIVWQGAAFDEELDSCDIRVGVSWGRWNSYWYETDEPNDPVEWAVFKNVPLTPHLKMQAHAEVQSASEVPGDGRIVLPEADRRPEALDLATGDLVPLPPVGPEPQKLEQALRDLGKGDLLYDCDMGDRTLILFRDATSEQARENTGEPSITAYLIGQQLPETVTVTTAEGRPYEITILAADNEACTLKYAPVAADRSTGGDAPVEPALKLANGVTVRFLAYSQLTGDGLIWRTSATDPTSIPGVHEADVDGLGTVLAFEVNPPDSEVYAHIYRGSERDLVKNAWRLPNSSIWLFPLGEQRNFANVELMTRVVEPPVVELIPLTRVDQGRVVDVSKFGIDKIVDLQVLSTGTSTAKQGAETTESLSSLYEGTAGSRASLPVIQFTVLPSPGSYPQVVALGDREGLTHPVVKTSGNARATTYEAYISLDRLTDVVVEASPARESSARFRNVSLTPGHATTVQIEADSQQQIVWQYSRVALGIRVFVDGLEQYQKDHGGRLPVSLQGMKACFFDENFDWLTEHMAYIGRGGLATNEPNVPIAYDETLLPQGKGTYMIYDDRRVQFESPKRLKQLGIATPEEKVVDVAPAMDLRDLKPASVKPAKLANGVTVDLLAYSRLDRAGLEWWTPQGLRTTIPGVYEADVEGHGSLLALRMKPEPEAGVSAWFFQPPDIRYGLKPVWRVNDSDIWLVPLGEGRSYANVEVTAQVRDPVVLTPVVLKQPSSGGVLEIGQSVIGRITDVQRVDSNSTAFTVHGLSGFSSQAAPEIVAALDTSRQVHSVRRMPLGQPDDMNPFGGPQRFQVDVPVDRFAGVVVEGYSERAGTVQFRNLSLRPGQPTEIYVDVDAQEAGPWWHSSGYRSELERLGGILLAHANETGGRFPVDLSSLRAVFDDAQWQWLQEHAVYIAAGKSSAQAGAVPLAYEKTLLPFGFGTYVLFSNGDISFQTPGQPKSLGIASVPATQSGPQKDANAAERSLMPFSSANGLAAKLPNGVTATLLGLFSGRDVNDFQSWYPDGTPVPSEQSAPFIRGLSAALSHMSILREYGFGYMLRVNAPEGATVRSVAGTMSPLMVITAGPAYPYTYFFPRGEARDPLLLPSVVNIQVVSAVGSYNTLEAEYHPESDSTELDEGNYRFVVSTLSAATAQRQGEITVTVNCDDVDVGLRFLDSKGDVQHATALLPMADEGAGPLRTFRFMSQHWPNSVKRILLDYRPAIAAAFKNVSLRPGGKTSVVVDAGPTPSESSVSLGAGPIGRHALSFDGVDDQLVVPPSPSLEFKGSMFLEMWLKLDPNMPASSVGHVVLMQKGRHSAGANRSQTGGFFLIGGRSIGPRAVCGATLILGDADGGKGYQVEIWQYPPLEQPGWYRVFARYDGHDYVPVPDQPLLIGNDPLPDGVPIKGEIAEIRIWNRALTDAEAHSYEAGSLTGNEPNLVACWDFERQSGGQIVYDISPNHNHAYLGTSQDRDDADPQWVGLDQTGRTVSREVGGQLVDPDGNPVAGAQVALCTVDHGVTIRAGTLVPRNPSGTGVEMLETRADGRFSFRRVPREFRLVAAHEDGFGWATNEEFVSSSELRLRPWGRIDGTLPVHDRLKLPACSTRSYTISMENHPALRRCPNSHSQKSPCESVSTEAV